VTNKGGRTSHSAIVARELGIAAIVGTGNATQIINDGQMITVANIEGDEGYVLEGNVPFEVITDDFSKVPKVDTTPLLILADPDRAFELSHYPAIGVGLLRMEFIINNSILIHPMALVQFDQLPESPIKNNIAQITTGYKSKTEYFIN
jgi:pyruvate,water dikinase